MKLTRPNNSSSSSSSSGFTLIEVLIVLAVLVVLVAIAVPQFAGMRRAYKESTVVKYMEQIGSAANSYKTNNGTKRYPVSLQVMFTKPASERLSLIPQPDEVADLDNVWVGDWYISWQGSGGANAFTCIAVPRDANNRRRLAVYEDGVVRSTTDGTTPTRTSTAVK